MAVEDKTRSHESLWEGSHAVFENFVTGRANQEAYDAAVHVANSPAADCNPLVIYGDSGFGKSYLIQSVGNQYKRRNSHARVCITSGFGEALSVEHAMQSSKAREARQFYSSMDLWVIDEFHWIVGKPVILKEILDSVDSLIDANKQVVIACQSLPAEIMAIEPRLASLLGRGLAVTLKRPGLKMRRDILLQKAARMGIPVGEDAALYIAKHVKHDVRELISAFMYIRHIAQQHGQAIDIDLAKRALSNGRLRFPPF